MVAMELLITNILFTNITMSSLNISLVLIIYLFFIRGKILFKRMVKNSIIKSVHCVYLKKHKNDG